MQHGHLSRAPGRLAAALIAAVLGACGGGGASLIQAQPRAQTVALAEAATFSVTVAAPPGTAVTYQWFLDGWPIEGATSSSITWRAAEVTDDGLAFSVEVSTPHASERSAEALLTVTGIPRAPAAGDLRFHGVDLAPVGVVLFAAGWRLGDPQVTLTGAGVAGTPLFVPLDGACAGGVCAWESLALQWFTPKDSPGPVRSYEAVSGPPSELKAAIMGLPASSVVTSLDVDDRGGYAMSVEGVEGVDVFELREHSVAEEDLGDGVAAESAAGRVVTAISSHDGQPFFVACGRQGDPTTFEAEVVHATFATAADEAATLAGAGYVVTAFGGDGAGGVFLVGTRVPGDTVPRPIAVEKVTGLSLPVMFERGFAVIGVLFAADGVTFIGEQ